MEEIRIKNDHSFCSIYYDKIQYVRLGFNEELDFTKKIEDGKPSPQLAS
jgi:hypothetical protein